MLRDEAGNLGWAAGAARRERGGPHDRPRRSGPRRARPAAPPADDAWGYRLAVPVPEHMVPLVPVRSRDDGALYLQRGRVEAGGGRPPGRWGRCSSPSRRC